MGYSNQSRARMPVRRSIFAAIRSEGRRCPLIMSAAMRAEHGPLGAFLLMACAIVSFVWLATALYSRSWRDAFVIVFMARTYHVGAALTQKV